MNFLTDSEFAEASSNWKCFKQERKEALRTSRGVPLEGIHPGVPPDRSSGGASHWNLKNKVTVKGIFRAYYLSNGSLKERLNKYKRLSRFLLEGRGRGRGRGSNDLMRFKGSKKVSVSV